MNSEEYQEIIQFLREQKYPEQYKTHGKQDGITKENCPPISLQNPTHFSRWIYF